MKLKDLAPHPQNPRKIGDEKLKMLEKSLKEFGDLSGVIYNKTTRRLVGGHQRVKVLPPDAEIRDGFIHVGNEKFTYREVEWDEAKEKAANIAANQHGGEWDLPKLTEWVNELDALNIDMDLLGFDEKELANLMAPVKNLGQCDEDEIPEHVEPKSKRGDIYQLGAHRLMCGDSTAITDVDALMGGEKADFTITSPPYNVGLSYNEYDDKKGESEYVEMLRAILGNIRTICSENYWILWNVGVYPLSLHLSLHLSLLRDYFTCRRSIAWVKQGITGPPVFYRSKQNPVVKNYQPNFSWEIIACCHLNEKSFGSREIPAEVLQDAMTDVWQISQHKDAKDQGRHPGAFPVALPERAIQLYAEENVYEPFGGSGSTLIACEKTNRRCFMMEIDPHYCDVIVARWEKFTGKKAALITGEEQANAE